MEVEVEIAENGVAPGVGLLAGCILVGVLAKLAFLYEFARLLEVDWINMWAWSLGEILGGAVAGLGAAIFFYALANKKLKSMMPGHWRLVAMAGVIAGDLLYAFFVLVGLIHDENNFIGVQMMLQQGIVSLAAVVLFGWVVRTTNETRIWRIYAWMCLVYYFLTLIASLTSISWFDGLGEQFRPLYLLSSMISNMIQLAILLPLVIAIVLDFRGKIPRDAYHYLGLILPIVVLLLEFFLNIFPYGFNWPI
ncbi:hypothetical protein C5Y97_26810 [Blastopirellula marina]|uniref:Uncharacterized protein n=2 Tax=Blastopirellula marina TaxID=124 RepID=A0A2S8F6E7_9BACT|nr:hypothetical protein C5Y98_26795 [Blastopirellula marina]PTL41449.1 hypothetical protein C5Y97_26810 [Blastopirellula marina]